MRIIMKCVYGSHLYGTNTEKSDTDYMGIFVNEVGEEWVKQINESTGNNKSKNGKDDIDCQMFNIDYWLELIQKNDIHAIDLLHVKPEQCLEYDPLWVWLYANRTKFYSKNVKKVVEYCLGQAAKYGVKGSRMAAVEDTIKVCDNFLKITGGRKNPSTGKPYKLDYIISQLPKSEFITPFIEGKDGVDMMEICNRKYQYTMSVKRFRIACIEVYDKYGERAKQAKENKGVDWKAVSHAFRAYHEIGRILHHHEYPLVFPFHKAHSDFLLKVKTGVYGWKRIKLLLEGNAVYLENSVKKSLLPETCDEEWIKTVRYYIYDKH